MRILHIVKTTNGAKWALDMVCELVNRGLDIHVALPYPKGILFKNWADSGANIHILEMDFPVTQPYLLFKKMSGIRSFIDLIKPDLIHTHFFGNTIMLRYALGKNYDKPRIFQVPGPLHLEHTLYRNWELSSKGKNDFWISSSKYINSLYIKSGIKASKLFLSYYGNYQTNANSTDTEIRAKYGFSRDDIIVGNINYIYPPKKYLGQTVGLKGHEVIIKGIALANKVNPNIKGLLIGGQWGGSNTYEKKLKRMAQVIGNGHIIMPGYIDHQIAFKAWYNIDIAIHTPLSENCGGVVEPLLAGIPTIASQTGGLPEVIINGLTGKILAGRSPELIKEAILEVSNNLNYYKNLAKNGQHLVTSMFDVVRTASEIYNIYNYVLNSSNEKPSEFDSVTFINSLGNINTFGQ